MNNINPINPFPDGLIPGKAKRVNGPNAPSFKDTMKGFMSDVNAMQHKAGVSIQKMVAGEITDVHQVMNSVQEAKVSFNMMMEIRNKMMDAYQEVMRMRI